MSRYGALKRWELENKNDNYTRQKDDNIAVWDLILHMNVLTMLLLYCILQHISHNR
jgi:hypothetical protein